MIVGYREGGAADREDGGEDVTDWDQAVVGAALGQWGDAEQAARRCRRDDDDALVPQATQVRGGEPLRRRS